MIVECGKNGIPADVKKLKAHLDVHLVGANLASEW